MNEAQHKKFEKWLEPYVLGFDIKEDISYIETDIGIISIGGPEHEKWLNEKKEEFLKKEPPLAGMVYVPWIIQTVPEGTTDTSRNEAVEQWENLHEVCPKCNNPNIMQSLVGIVWHVGEPYEDNVNTAFCGKCEWNGKVNELKPKPNETTTEQN